jgi:hypothetical protein
MPNRTGKDVSSTQDSVVAISECLSLFSLVFPTGIACRSGFLRSELMQKSSARLELSGFAVAGEIAPESVLIEVKQCSKDQ